MEKKKKPSNPSSINILEGITNGDKSKQKALQVLSEIDNKLLTINKTFENNLNGINTHFEQSIDKVGKIAENANQSTNLINDKKGILFNLKELGVYLKVLQDRLKHHENEFMGFLTSIEISISNFGLLFSPLKAIASNLVKLKTLFSEIKLTNKIFDKNIKGFSEEESLKIENILVKIEQVIPFFVENIYNIQTHAKSLFEEFGPNYVQKISKIIKMIDRIIENIGIFEGHYKSIIEKNNLRKMSEECDNQISGIISVNKSLRNNNHEIEHIQKTHKRIIEEISQFSDNGGSKEINKFPYLSNISLILEIEALQLLLAKNKSKTTLSNVINNLNSFSNNLFELSKINNGVKTIEIPGSEPLKLTALTELFDDIVEDAGLCCANYKDFEAEIKVLAGVSKQLCERFMDIDMMDNSVEQAIINKITEENFLNNPEINTAKQSQEVLRVYADNHFEKNKIREIFESLIEELSSIINGNSFNVFSFKGVSSMGELLNKLKLYYNNTRTKISEVNKKCSESVEICTEIISVSKDAIVNINNCDFIEDIIKDLIMQFNIMNPEILSLQSEPVCEVAKHDDMQEIEKCTLKLQTILNDGNINKDVITEILIPGVFEKIHYHYGT